MKKRIISAVAALFMLFSLLSFSVFADDTDGKLNIANVGRVTAGSTFKLTMTLEGVSEETLSGGIITLSFELEYDHSLIETTDKSISGKGIDGWEVSGNVSDSVCTFMLCDIEGKKPVTKNGALAVTLEFTVASDAAGEDVIIETKNVAISDENFDSFEVATDTIDFTVAKKSTVTTVVNGVTYYVDADSKTASLSAVSDKSAENLVIPSSISYNGADYKVTAIESGAFVGFTALKSVYIPCTVTSISPDALDGSAITIKGCASSAAYRFAMSDGYNWEVDTSKYTEKVVKESTCTEHGSSQLTCADCGEKAGTPKELPLVDHKYGEWVVTKPATDNEEGSRERTCSVCGVKDTEIIPKTNCPHTEKKDVITKAPTCTATGTKNVVCASCGKVLEENIEVAKIPHTFGEWVVTKPATVKEKGSREHTCTVCNTKETEEIPVVACKHSNTTNGHRDPTCTKDGYDSTTCKDCGKLLSYTALKAKHTEGPTETKAATCTEDGYVIQKCTACGEVLKNEVTTATGHEFGEWTELVPPTVDTEGVRTHTCTKCGQLENETIPRLEPPAESSSEESVPPLEASDDESSSTSLSSTSKDEGSGSNKTIFFVIGAIVILLTIAYIVIMAINKRKNY